MLHVAFSKLIWIYGYKLESVCHKIVPERRKSVYLIPDNGCELFGWDPRPVASMFMSLNLGVII
jgi:hypothetical protein